MNEEDSQVSRNIGQQNQRTIAKPCPHIKVFLGSRDLIILWVSKSHGKFMIEHLYKAERKENQTPDQKHNRAANCNRNVKYVKKYQVEDFSLLISKWKKAWSVKYVQCWERNWYTDHYRTSFVCPCDWSDFQSWLIIVILLELSFLSIQSCRHGNEIGDDK